MTPTPPLDGGLPGAQGDDDAAADAGIDDAAEDAAAADGDSAESGAIAARASPGRGS